MTIHDFLYNLSTFDGRAYKQKELYANLILNPNQSIQMKKQNIFLIIF